MSHASNILAQLREAEASGDLSDELREDIEERIEELETGEGEP